MKANFMARFLLALLVLAIFGAYSYVRASYTPFSDELERAREASAAPVIVAVTPQAVFPEAEPTVAAPEVSAEPEPTPAPTLDPESPAGRAAALGLPAPPEIDVTSWEYVLVNGDHSIGTYEPAELGYLNQTADATDIQTSYNPNRCPVDLRIAQALLDMALGCREAGLPVYLSSGYRSYSVQQQNFKRVCDNNGITDGKDAEGYYITMPAGCSEHQTGLGVDITDKYYEIKRDDKVASATIDWLQAHCAEYGFVLRFPKDKRPITQVMGESWHFRYVGKEVAAYMTENNLVLEEFLALYGVN